MLSDIADFSLFFGSKKQWRFFHDLFRRIGQPGFLEESENIRLVAGSKPNRGRLTHPGIRSTVGRHYPEKYFSIVLTRHNAHILKHMESITMTQKCNVKPKQLSPRCIKSESRAI